MGRDLPELKLGEIAKINAYFFYYRKHETNYRFLKSISRGTFRGFMHTNRSGIEFSTTLDGSRMPKHMFPLAKAEESDLSFFHISRFGNIFGS